MDQVIEAGWRNAFNVMKTNYSLTDDAIGVFAINLRFNLDDIQTIVSEAITGGGDDKKCDVLYVDKEREIAVIAQCYISKTLREAAPSNKASDLNTALTWLLSTNLDNLPDALKGRADELRSAIEAGEVKQFYIWYVHNLPCSKNVQDELRAVENTARAALTRYPSGQDINIFAEEISEEQCSRTCKIPSRNGSSAWLMRGCSSLKAKDPRAGKISDATRSGRSRRHFET